MYKINRHLLYGIRQPYSVVNVTINELYSMIIAYCVLLNIEIFTSKNCF